MDEPSRGGPGAAWSNLRQKTARLYARLMTSCFGRMMTGYRRVDGTLADRRHRSGQYRFRPVSPARLAVAESVEGSLIVRFLRAFLHGLYLCPLQIYGLFFAFCGLFQSMAYLLYTEVSAVTELVPRTLDITYMIAAIVAVLVAFPLLFSRTRLCDALARSRIADLLLKRLLGIPLGTVTEPRKKASPWLLCPACLIAAALVVASLWFSPAVIVSMVMAVALFGMIFAYPETGAVLGTVLLPIAWLQDGSSLPFAVTAIILLTWISYIFNLLAMRRTFRFSYLDAAILLFGIVILLSGLTGPTATWQSALRCVSLFIGMSDYFLVVNLITTRAYVGRCLFGFGVSGVLLVILSYFRMLSPTELDWMAGSRAGDALVDLFGGILSRMSGLWNEQTIFFLILMVPLCYAGFVRTKRLFFRVMLCLLVLADVSILWINRAIVPLFCIACMTVIYCILSGNKGPARGMILMPTVGGLALVLGACAQPILGALQSVLAYDQGGMGVKVGELWAVACRYPAGYGIDAVYDSGNLFFELVHNFGWQGLILAVAIAFFLTQKSMTALYYTVMQGNRCLVTATLTTLAGVLLYGAVNTWICSSGIMLTMAMLVALCGAYENILFDESDIYMAESMNVEIGVDRTIRKW